MLLTLSLFASASDVLSIESFQAAPVHKEPNPCIYVATSAESQQERKTKKKKTKKKKTKTYDERQNCTCVILKSSTCGAGALYYDFRIYMY